MASKNQNELTNLTRGIIATSFIIIGTILVKKDSLSPLFSDCYMMQLAIALVATFIFSILAKYKPTVWTLNILIFSTLFSVYSLNNLSTQAEKMLDNIEKLKTEQALCAQKIEESRADENQSNQNKPIDSLKNQATSESENKNNNVESKSNPETFRFFLNLLNNLFGVFLIFLSAGLFFVRDNLAKLNNK